MMKQHAELADRYLDAWNETDPAARRALIDEVWAEAGRYADPLAKVEGREGFDALVAAVQQRFPAHRFTRSGAVDAHDCGIRFAWQLVDAQGRTVARGTDFAETDADGRLQRVIGFLDAVQDHAVQDHAVQGSAPKDKDAPRAARGPNAARSWGVDHFAGFWAAPDLSRPSAALAPEVEGWWPGLAEPLRGIADYVRPLRALLERVPDFRLEVAEHASRDDLVFIRWIAHGTLDGERLEFTGVDRVRHRDGKVVENRIFCDHPLVRSLFEPVEPAEPIEPAERVEAAS